MSDEKFAIERLGVWPKQLAGGGAIDMDQWRKLMDPESRRDGDIALAVDIAPERDYAAIALYGIRVDGIGHTQLVDYRPGTDWVLGRLLELRAALDPIAIGMGRAVAASLEVDLEKEGVTRSANLDEPVRGDLAVTTYVEMSAATGQILDAVRQGTFRHPGQMELDTSVAGAKTRLTGDSLAWARKDASADTSPLVAVTLARWAYESRAHLVRAADYDVMESVF
jgi:hypothetical protein